MSDPRHARDTPSRPLSSASSRAERRWDGVTQRELSTHEVDRCARCATDTLAQWLPFELASAAGNNASCALIGERLPLSVDLRRQLLESLTNAIGIAAREAPAPLAAAQLERAVSQAAASVRSVIAGALAVRGVSLVQSADEHG